MENPLTGTQKKRTTPEGAVPIVNLNWFKLLRDNASHLENLV